MIKRISELSKDTIISGVERIGFSEWMIKCIQYDGIKSAHLSETTTKTLRRSGIKIEKSLWKKLCNVNLELLYETENKRVKD